MLHDVQTENICRDGVHRPELSDTFREERDESPIALDGEQWRNFPFSFPNSQFALARERPRQHTEPSTDFDGRDFQIGLARSDHGIENFRVDEEVLAEALEGTKMMCLEVRGEPLWIKERIAERSAADCLLSAAHCPLLHSLHFHSEDAGAERGEFFEGVTAQVNDPLLPKRSATHDRDNHGTSVVRRDLYLGSERKRAMCRGEDTLRSIP